MLGFVPDRRDRVLEVGCGEGRFIRSLTGVGEKWGIEPSAAADVARGWMRHVSRSTFDEASAELLLDYIDVVICTAANAISSLTFGYCSDVRFGQIAFQAVLPETSRNNWRTVTVGECLRPDVNWIAGSVIVCTRERRDFRSQDHRSGPRCFPTACLTFSRPAVSDT